MGLPNVSLIVPSSPYGNQDLKCKQTLFVLYSLFSNILGIFASCCHHLCTWESFYGRHPIVNQKLFTMLKTISSWAVCGFREQSTVNQERILLGDTAKRLLDHYRYEGLKRIGLEVDKFDYVPAEVTLENRAVVFSTSLRKIDT